MGVTVPSRCRVCGGTGSLSLNNTQEALYDWLEGYLDPTTSEEWLEDQLRRLMEIRGRVVKGED